VQFSSFERGEPAFAAGKEGEQMGEQERDRRLQQIQDLEQRHRRRKLVLLTVAAVRVLLGGVSFSTFFVVKARWQQ
jgi:hypothetical protein